MNILISGGSRGIGRAAAELFAARGHRVAYTYFGTEPLAPGIAIKCDVRDRRQAADFVSKAIEELGGADVLICCAGVSWTGLFTDMAPEDFNRVMETNFGGTYNLCQAAAPHFIAKKSGNIITVASMWGLGGASCEAVYSASKGAVIAFSKALAKELAPSGIRVNALAPGAVDTEMCAGLTGADRSAFMAETPLGRLATPEEMAGYLYFLASEDSAFMTGQVLSPNGGVVI